MHSSSRHFSSSPYNSSSSSVKYIYDLPYFERKEICRIFDENNQWETLGGGLMGYSTSELSEFGRMVYRGGSPTDALLTSWGNQNHTVLELFTLCGRMYHGRAMKVLAKFVDSKYHSYIPDVSFQATEELVGIDPPINAPSHPPPHSHHLADLDKKKGREGGNHPSPKANTRTKGEPCIIAQESAGLLPQIPYNELTTATNDWDRRNMLGKGGFGTVYKGLWKNTAVAIKRMDQQRHPPNDIDAYIESQMKQSLGEMRFLNSYRHDNILPLYGYSLEGQHPCLVYQFMTNGSLEDRILCRQRTPPLGWQLRFLIAKGVACGIQFLHSIGTQPLIHGDIKSANILLDRNFEPKVGDFGLAREMGSPSGSAEYVKVSRVHGTRPYLPDEYLRNKKLSTKVDSYSFGIVLFELATGLRAYDDQRQKKFLKEVIEEYFESPLAEAKLKDPKGGPDHPEVFHVLLNLGRMCIERVPKKRPEMVEVLKTLEASVSTASASIRTTSTQQHFTGLPYLFEVGSRPGSHNLAVPQAPTSSRNSPEIMRAGSPHYHPQFSGLPSPGRNNTNNNNTSSRPPTQIPPQPHPSTSTTSSNTNNLILLGTSPVMSPPDLMVIHPSPSPSPVNNEDNNNTSPLDNDLYLPLVLEDHHKVEQEGTSNNENYYNYDGTNETADIANTVIPLITELGIKEIRGEK